MTLKHLPPTFCWTKIGHESGEELPTIVLRKEWERRLGGGRFLWGIGQPLGNGAQIAAHRTGSLIALFSPASSKPKPCPAGKKHEGSLLWNAWIDTNGQVRELPRHAFITSSATLPSGQSRAHYYALVCSSPTELSIGTRLRIHPDRLRHVSTGKTLGAAQSTAVVDCVERAFAGALGKSYPLALSVELEAPYFVRLAQPSLLKARDLAEVIKTSRDGDFETFAEQVVRLRNRTATEHVRGFTRDLFDLPASDAGMPFSAATHHHASHAW